LDRAVGIEPGGFLLSVVVHEVFLLAVKGHAARVAAVKAGRLEARVEE